MFLTIHVFNLLNIDNIPQLYLLAQMYTNFIYSIYNLNTSDIDLVYFIPVRVAVNIIHILSCMLKNACNFRDFRPSYSYSSGLAATKACSDRKLVWRNGFAAQTTDLVMS